MNPLHERIHNLNDGRGKFTQAQEVFQVYFPIYLAPKFKKNIKSRRKCKNFNLGRITNCTRKFV